MIEHLELSSDDRPASPGPPPRRPAGPGLLENLFVVLALLAMTGALVSAEVATETSTATSETLQDPRQAVVFGVIYVISLLLILYRRSLGSILTRVDGLTATLLVLCLMSFLWSVDPGLSIRRSVALGGTIMFAYYISDRYPLQHFLRLAGFAFLLLIGLTLLSPFLTPEYLDPLGRWKGVLPNKNTLGRLMSLAVILGLIMLTSHRRNRPLWVSLVIGAAVCLLLSESLSAMVALVLVFAVVPSARFLKKDIFGGIGFMLLVAAAGGIALGYLMTQLDVVLGFVGKDVTLTGRTYLWGVITEAAMDRFWLGYGYSAFWRGAIGPSGLVWMAVPWLPPHGHNGYLDLWLQTGFLGMTLFVTMLLRGLSRAAYFLDGVSPERAWPFAYLTFTIIANVTESAAFTSNSILTVFLVTAIAYSHGGRTSDLVNPQDPRS